jgi:hypothetical protein
MLVVMTHKLYLRRKTLSFGQLINLAFLRIQKDGKGLLRYEARECCHQTHQSKRENIIFKFVSQCAKF